RLLIDQVSWRSLNHAKRRKSMGLEPSAVAVPKIRARAVSGGALPYMTSPLIVLFYQVDERWVIGQFDFGR
ncbi:hypothetical protein, partial [Paracoccus marcusii]|uniref:hypothetical protein n=1 Tax=Paracoccus marcusii TaxID=59779 RepID=UPI00249089A8